jgi:hypothetical protein
MIFAHGYGSRRGSHLQATLNPLAQAALKDIPEAALKKIEASRDSGVTNVSGWSVWKGLGTYAPPTT